MARADFSGAMLESADFAGCMARDANFTGANLAGADLAGSNLRRANFTGADLRGADLCGTDLSQAILVNANLAGAEHESELSGDNPRSRSARSPARASLWRGALAIEKRRRRTNASGVEKRDLTTSPDASNLTLR